jgi:hypothetical protein
MSLWKKILGLENKNQRNTELGRNDPCWCNSGKKYKKCHMEEDAQKHSRRLAAKNHPKSFG